MFDFTDEQLRSSLTDAITWYAIQSPEVEDGDRSEMLRRRALVEQANQLWLEARTMTSKSLFHRKISETEQWQAAVALLEEVRASLGPLEHKLRSVTLKPTFPLDTIGEEALWVEAVAEVVNTRHQLIDRISPEQRTTHGDEGRLLLYYPYENLADGAAQQSSNGFFDADNVPPWDTWVSFSEGVLLSWVPPSLIEAAQMGIDANPEECIRWAG
jgi:hypothetical protein